MYASSEWLAHIETVARRVLVGIPGVTVEGVERRKSRPANFGGVPQSRPRHIAPALIIAGWTSSLHGSHIVVPIRGADDLEAKVEACAITQKRRQREAMKAGIRVPCHLRTRGDIRDRPTDVAHLSCDRAALAIMLEQNDHDPRKVGDVLAQAVDDDHHMRNGGDIPLGLESPHRLNATRIEACIVMSDVRLRGNTLTLPLAMPHTMLNGIVGRRLRDVAHIHRLLDHRVIRTAEISEYDDQRTCVRLAPDSVRIGDVLTL